MVHEILAALIAIAGAAMVRLAIERVVGGVAPFVLTFPAVMVATLAAGGRAGLAAVVGCQLLTIRFVFPNWMHHGPWPNDLANLTLATAALCGTVWATASYRRSAAELRGQHLREIATLSIAIAEMDHRTKNNFQVAANLLAHQAAAVADPEVTRELDLAASRLNAIASVYQDLSLADTTRGGIDLGDHLQRIVELLRKGALPTNVMLTIEADPILLTAQASIIVGLIANEWITNALQHAFHDAAGRIHVSATRHEDRIELMVEDDGTGRAATTRLGGGSDLMRSLADVIDGHIRIDHPCGTRCTLTIAVPTHTRGLAIGSTPDPRAA